MDVRQYFRKLREIEAGIVEEFPIVVSLDTDDGGKAGVASEVSRFNAAKLLVEGRATLAGESAIAGYRNRQIAEREAFEAVDFAKKVQISIVDHQVLNHVRDRKNPVPSGTGK